MPIITEDKKNNINDIHKELDKFLIDKNYYIKKNSIEPIKDQDKAFLGNLFNSGLISTTQTNEDTLGKDLQEIVKELSKTENRFLYGNTLKAFAWTDARLFAYQQKFKDNPKKQKLYNFIKDFRLQFATNRSAIKGGMRTTFENISSALMMFRGGYEWRRAIVPEPFEQDNLKDKLKNRLNKK